MCLVSGVTSVYTYTTGSILEYVQVELIELSNEEFTHLIHELACRPYAEHNQSLLIFSQTQFPNSGMGEKERINRYIDNMETLVGILECKWI